MNLSLGVLLSERAYADLLAGGHPGLRQMAQLWRQEHAVRALFLPVARAQPGRESATLARLTRGGALKESERPLPRHYLNWLGPAGPEDGRALRRLTTDGRAVVFNETNRWNRGMAFEMVATDREAAPLVPPTSPWGGLPPPGAHICLLAPGRRSAIQGGALLEVMAGRLQRLGPRLPTRLRWVSQLPGVPAGPQGLPAEWRFYLHREAERWQVAAAVVKREGLRGSTPEACWPVGEALALTFGRAKSPVGERLRTGAVAVARALARFLPGVVHLAVDFWVTNEGSPVLVDLVGRYRLDWLRRIGDAEGLARVRSFPARFALALARGNE